MGTHGDSVVRGGVALGRIATDADPRGSEAPCGWARGQGRGAMGEAREARDRKRHGLEYR